jgi:uncharacterized damage-inducible protein DinB
MQHRDSLRKLIRHVRDHIHHIPADALTQRPAPGKWSRQEVLGHLTDSALNNLKRFAEATRLQEGPYVVMSYAQDHLVAQNDYQNQDFGELVLLWQALNSQICRILDRLSEADLLRPVDIKGEVHTLGFLIDDYIRHLQHHLGQIFDGKYAPAPFPVHFDVESAQIALQNVPTEFVQLLRFGDFELEYYAPDGTDKQQPHSRDEAYFIAQGRAVFLLEQARMDVKAGDFLFVKAGQEHRFEDFSADFATWVVFYGLNRFD